SLGSYQDVLYSLELSDSNYSIGDVVLSDESIVGVVVGEGPVIGIINQNYIPEQGDTLSIGTVLSSVELTNLTNVEEHYEEILASNQALRERTTDLPGPVAGLHWFNDRLYAVASVAK